MRMSDWEIEHQEMFGLALETNSNYDLIIEFMRSHMGSVCEQYVDELIVTGEEAGLLWVQEERIGLTEEWYWINKRKI